MGAPDLETSFKKATATAVKMWTALDGLVSALDDQESLCSQMEYIALRHMGVDATAAHVHVFKEVLLEMCASKLGGVLSPGFRTGMSTLMDAMGKTIIATRGQYQHRLKILASSWSMLRTDPDDLGEAAVQEAAAEEDEDGFGNLLHEDTEVSDNKASMIIGNIKIPKTFTDMAMFNASVMGVGDRPWITDMLEEFDDMVLHASDTVRLQEECDCTSLILSKYPNVVLSEFKSLMFASLRSLLPKQWNTDYENAWSWLWSCIEHKLEANRGLRAKQQPIVNNFFAQMDDEGLAEFKLEMFETFFSHASQSQEYLRSSNSKLQFIFGRIINLMNQIYVDTRAAVKEISALGLLHAGYGVPEDLLPPFVEACMIVVNKNCNYDNNTSHCIWWCLDLVSRILTRTLTEGSTAVMQSINSNSGKQLQKAISTAARGERERLLLRVQVGTESISPLFWAIQTGAMQTAGAILSDLLAIRADRSRYYYGLDALFNRHPDIVPLLCSQAPTLLPTLLDGLMWRSKKVVGGTRRVNYYINRILLDEHGSLTHSIHDVIKHQDPVIICHPCLTFISDLLWSSMCRSTFLITKLWFVLTLMDYIVAQQYGILMFDSAGEGRWALIGCRAFMYFCSFGQLAGKHGYMITKAVRSKALTKVFGFFPFPTYLLQSRQEFTEFALATALACMICIEPFLHCLKVSPRWITNCCAYDEWYCELSNSYDRTSTFPMLLYFILAAELIHLNIDLSAFVIICVTLFSDFIVFLGSLVFISMAFASTMSCLPQYDDIQLRDFYNFPSSFYSIFSIGLKVYGADKFQEIATAGEHWLMFWVMFFAAVWHRFMMSLIVAQLCQRYAAIHGHAMGRARLLRGTLIFETAMPLITKTRWAKFVQSLKLDEACELDEGDVGPKGAVQVLEAPEEYSSHASLPLDRVIRFGGLASPLLPWPEHGDQDNEDPMVKLEKMAMTRFSQLEQLMNDMAASIGKLSQSTTGKLCQLKDGQRLTQEMEVEDEKEGGCEEEQEEEWEEEEEVTEQVAEVFEDSSDPKYHTKAL